MPETVFKVVHEMSGPFKQVANATNALKTSTERAKTVVDKAGTGAEAATARPRQLLGETPEEQERLKTAREESRLRRARIQQIKLSSAKEDAAMRGATAALLFTGYKGTEHGERIIKASAAMQIVGTSMAGMSGAAGALGRRMEGFASKVGLIGAALEVGLGIGTFLNETFDLTNKISGKSAKEMAEQNEKFARSIGYRTAEEYGAARIVAGQAKKERELASAVSKQAALLGAMPTDRTGAAMAAYEAELLKAALAVSRQTGVKLDEAIGALKGSTENTAQTLIGNQKRTLDLASAIGDEIRTRKIAAPLQDASNELQKQYLSSLGAAIQSLHLAGKITATEVPVALELAQKRAEEAAASSRVTDELRREELQRSEMNTVIAQHRAAARKSGISLQDMNIALDATESVFATLGAKLGDIAPELKKTIYERLRQTSTDRTKQPNFDFRNSRFDIKQAFAEGFDPDRIAVAFAQDLAALGERRLQSGFAPLFSAS